MNIEKETLINNLNKYKSFDFNGYHISKIEPEGNGRLILYYEPLFIYRVYNTLSPVGDCEVFQSKEELIQYVLEENKAASYYERLSELNSMIDFDFSIDLFNYIEDWTNNYFKRKPDCQLKYKNGQLSKKCKSAYLYLDDECLCMKSEDGKKYLEIDTLDPNIAELIVTFKQRIKGSIRAIFPIKLIGNFPTTYDMLKYKCLNDWYSSNLEEIIRNAYNQNKISEEQYLELMSTKKGL